MAARDWRQQDPVQRDQVVDQFGRCFVKDAKDVEHNIFINSHSKAQYMNNVQNIINRAMSVMQQQASTGQSQMRPTGGAVPPGVAMVPQGQYSYDSQQPIRMQQSGQPMMSQQQPPQQGFYPGQGQPQQQQQQSEQERLALSRGGVMQIRGANMSQLQYSQQQQQQQFYRAQNSQASQQGQMMYPPQQQPPQQQRVTTIPENLMSVFNHLSPAQREKLLQVDPVQQQQQLTALRDKLIQKQQLQQGYNPAGQQQQQLPPGHMQQPQSMMTSQQQLVGGNPPQGMMPPRSQVPMQQPQQQPQSQIGALLQQTDRGYPQSSQQHASIQQQQQPPSYQAQMSGGMPDGQPSAPQMSSQLQQPQIQMPPAYSQGPGGPTPVSAVNAVQARLSAMPGSVGQIQAGASPGLNIGTSPASIPQPKSVPEASPSGAADQDDPTYKETLQRMIKLYRDRVKRALEAKHNASDDGMNFAKKLQAMLNVLEGRTKPTYEKLIVYEDSLKKVFSVVSENELFEASLNVLKSNAVNADSVFMQAFRSHYDGIPAKRIKAPSLSNEELTEFHSTDCCGNKVEDDQNSLPIVLEREIACLDRRFQINTAIPSEDCFDFDEFSDADEVRLSCQIEEPTLPLVPPLLLTVPSQYPGVGLRFDEQFSDYAGRPFLEDLQKLLISRFGKLSSVPTLTAVLNAWESCVKQATTAAGVIPLISPSSS